jgi:hypothetical protein
VVNAGTGCEFCSEAADDRYAEGDLMPLHPGCQCSVEPATD